MSDRGYLQTPEQWTRLLSAFTHELRTPLASLRMLAELLAASQTQPSPDKRYTDNMQEVVHDIQALVSDVAELSRLLADRVEYREAEVPLKPLVERVKEAVRPRAWERGIAIEDSLDPALPRLLRSDPDHLRQALTLLLGAAVGHARSEVFFRLDLGDGELRTIVSSDGPLFPDAALPAIFEPFEQGAKAVRRNGGRSLAPTLANELTRVLGGSLRAANWGGRPTFHLSLPLAQGL